MHSQAGAELYTSQSIPSAYRQFSHATEWYNNQSIALIDQTTWYIHQQMTRLPRKSYFLTTNFDDTYEQGRPVRDFTLQLQTLHRHYTIMDDDRTVIQLLEEEPQLYSLLLEAVAPLQQAFGDKCLVYIRMEACDEDSVMKVAIWLPAGFSDDPERALEAFDQAWWLKNCHRSGGALVFDYEMQDAIRLA